MARHDAENQPQSPDLGASVQLESGESLEDTVDSDPLDAGYIPPDRPYLLDEDGVTGAGMRDGDTLDQRLRREQDAEPVDPDRAGRLSSPTRVPRWRHRMPWTEWTSASTAGPPRPRRRRCTR